MAKGAQPFPFTLTISAPIRDSGSIIRFIGRFWIEASPVKVTSKFCADKIPEIRRVVVPLFPQSNTVSGFLRPRRPFPCTRTISPLFSIAIPILSKQEIVDRQSAPCKNPVISVVPFAREPNITARWEMDLSPGTVISPFNGPDFLNSISSSQTVRLTAVPFRIYSIPAVSMLRS